MKPTLFFLCGLPGSGKSTFAEHLAKEENAIVFSSDKIREDLLGSTFDSTSNHNNHSKQANTKVFVELNKQIKAALREGQNAVYDATNISSKRRAAFLRELKDIPCRKECYIILRTLDDCIEANEKRGNSVPESVIKRMYENWNTPYFFEGWDKIYAVYTDHNMGCLGRAIDIPDTLKSYNQCNYHHALSLGDHLYKCWECLDSSLPDTCELTREELNSLAEAALTHDIGKPYTKTFMNYNGLVTPDAHYYNHQNTGAYEVLFLQSDYLDGLLLTSVLVNLHMQPYFWSSNHSQEEANKLHKKYANIWGTKLYELVMSLHNADVMAH